MSRSYKKHSFTSWHSSKSMKAWRSQENRRLRHNAKQIINTCEDYDALIIPVLDDYDTLWGSPQDGCKHYQPKTYLNQCEIDAYNYLVRWSSSFHWEKHVNRANKILEHEIYCGCYSNKRGWYWKNLRK